jgi:hypothetical protein
MGVVCHMRRRIRACHMRTWELVVADGRCMSYEEEDMCMSYEEKKLVIADG